MHSKHKKKQIYLQVILVRPSVFRFLNSKNLCWIWIRLHKKEPYSKHYYIYYIIIITPTCIRTFVNFSYYNGNSNAVVGKFY
jgi:hypothetical protein